jgi:hypothetical protein
MTVIARSIVPLGGPLVSSFVPWRVTSVAMVSMERLLY